MSPFQKISALMTAAALSIGALAAPGFAKSDLSYGKFTTQYGLRGVGDASDPSRFDILQNAGSGGSDYWCAAGEYAIKKLGVSPATRVYLVQPLAKGRLGRNSVGFSVNPNAVPSAGSNGFTMSITKVGQNWSAEHARSQCKSTGRRDR